MLVIDPAAEAPPFEQIKRQIDAGRTSGEFPAGHRLPPVRRLADELGVAPNTVARAYRELEASGVIETRGRAGSFVTGTTESVPRQAAAAARAYLATLGGLGLTASQAEDVLRRVASEAAVVVVDP